MSTIAYAMRPKVRYVSIGTLPSPYLFFALEDHRFPDFVPVKDEQVVSNHFTPIRTQSKQESSGKMTMRLGK